MATIGGWPSGKAPGFGPGIRGFESLTPSHEFITDVRRSLFGRFICLFPTPPLLFRSLIPIFSFNLLC